MCIALLQTPLFSILLRFSQCERTDNITTFMYANSGKDLETDSIPR